MTVFRIERCQALNLELVQAWDFFASPVNLARITPPWLDFRITSDVRGDIYPGLIITYRLRPFAGVPLTWVTEITHCRPPHYFIDEQRAGPYRFWHHEHRFTTGQGGTVVQDIVHYILPWGPLGILAHRLSVRSRLQRIFDYRRDWLNEEFNADGNAGAGRGGPTAVS